MPSPFFSTLIKWGWRFHRRKENTITNMHHHSKFLNKLYSWRKKSQSLKFKGTQYLQNEKNHKNAFFFKFCHIHIFNVKFIIESISDVSFARKNIVFSIKTNILMEVRLKRKNAKTLGVLWTSNMPDIYCFQSSSGLLRCWQTPAKKQQKWHHPLRMAVEWYYMWHKFVHYCLLFGVTCLWEKCSVGIKSNNKNNQN